MTEKQHVLNAFITQKLAEHEIAPDAAILAALHQAVQLDYGEPDETEETRSVSITQATDGSYSAESIKLWNLMQISMRDVVDFLLKSSGIAISGDPKVKIGLAILVLIHEFYPKLSYKFDKQDANLLMALYQSGKKEFAAAEIAALYEELMAAGLSPEQLARSLELLTQLKVLRPLGEQRYALREHLSFERKA